MNTKKIITSYNTADGERISCMLRHYINAQHLDGVSKQDLLIAFEEALKYVENIHEQGRKSLHQLSRPEEVSKLLQRISEQAWKDLRNSRGASNSGTD